jgi:cell division protein FtsW (lipid II flippase)
MILTLFNPALQGAQRWIVVGGFSFQPSELAKMTLILYLAHIFSKKGYDIKDFKRGLLPPLVVVVVFLVLTLMQNDYSTMIFLAVLALGMFFVAGLQNRYFIILGTVGLPLSIIYLFLEEYRVLRILNFLNPFRDPTHSSFQILSSLRTLGEGGLWGGGLGAGVRKLGGLPDVQADYILANVGEEVGFLGILIVFTLFSLLFYRGVRISFSHKNMFYKYLGLGISFSIFLQFLLNAGVVVGALPATGIPLPFFSAGGSSLLITLLMMGVLLGLSRQQRPSPGRRFLVAESKVKPKGFHPALILDFFRRPDEIRKILIWAIIVLLILLCVELIFHFFLAPSMRISRLRLLGDDIRISDEELLSWMGYQERPYYFSFDQDDMEEILSGHPRIRSASVEKVFPDQLEITIDARQALVLAFFDSGEQGNGMGNMLVDEEGVIIAVNDPEPGLNLPVLSGLRVAEAAEGSTFPSDVPALPAGPVQPAPAEPPGFRT